MSTTTPQITFGPKLVKKVGKIGKVMKELLYRRQVEIQKELKKQFPESIFPSNVVNVMLQPLVTVDGTRSCASLEELKQVVPELNERQLLFCLDYLEDSRIILDNSGVYELAHDTLAYHINARRTEGQKEMMHRLKMVDDKFMLFPETHTYLNRRELLLLREHLPELEKRLTDDKWAFILKSQKEEKKRRIAKSLLIFGSILCLIAFSAWSYYHWDVAAKEKLKADAAAGNAEKAELVAKAQTTIFKQTNDMRASIEKNRTNAILSASKLLGSEEFSKHENEGVRKLLNHANEIKNDLLIKVEKYPLYQIVDNLEDNVIINQWNHYYFDRDSSNAFFLILNESRDLIRYRMYHQGDNTSHRDTTFTHNSKILDATFAPNGKSILAVDEKENLISIDLKTGEIQRLKNFKIPLQFIKIGHNKKYLILAGNKENGTSHIYRYNLKNRVLTTVQSDLQAQIFKIKTSPIEEKLALIEKYKQNLTIISYGEYHILDERNINDTPNDLCFTHNGKKVAVSGLRNNQAKILDIENPNAITTLTNGHSQKIIEIRYSEKDNTIFTGGNDNKAVKWDTDGNILKEFVGHQAPVNKIWETGDEFVISADKKGDLRFWNQSSYEVGKPYKFDNKIYTLSPSPIDPNIIAVSLEDNSSSYYILDLEKENWDRKKINQKIGSKATKTNLILEYDVDGQHIYSGGGNWLVQKHGIDGNFQDDWRGGLFKGAVLDIEASKNFLGLAYHSRAVFINQSNDETTSIDSIGNVTEVAISPDEKLFLIGGKKGFRLFSNNKNTLTQLGKFPNNENSIIEVDNVKQIVWQNDSQHFATSGEDNNINIWKVMDDKIHHLQTFEGHDMEITDLAFSPDGKKLLSSGKDGTVKLWNSIEGRYSQAPSLIVHKPGINDAVFNMDGTKIITGGLDKTVRIWPSNFENAILERTFQENE